MFITEALRGHLIANQDTLYRVAKDTGISWATLKRFTDGGGLRSDQMDKLAAYFGLELQPAAEKKKRGK